jgi:hypothetical protein
VRQAMGTRVDGLESVLQTRHERGHGPVEEKAGEGDEVLPRHHLAVS